MIAGTRKRGPELRHRPKGDAESRSRAPRGAAAGDPAVISGDPAVISGDPEIGVTARHATGAAFRTSAYRRSAPPPSLLWSYGGQAPHPPSRAIAGLPAEASAKAGREALAV